MSVEENIRSIEAFEEIFNSRDWDRFDEQHAESVVTYGPTQPEPTRGLAAHREEMQNLVKSFPDLRAKTERTIGQGDWVCMEATFTGTHKGPLQSPSGQMIPPTNKPVRISVCSMVKFEGGKIAEERTYFDLFGMMAQLGLIPENQPAGEEP